MNKKIFYILILICGALFCFFVYLFLSSIKPAANTNTPGQTPKITPFPTSTSQKSVDAVSGALKETTAEGKEFNRRSSLVGALVDKAPYIGTNFTFTYDYDANLFRVNIDPKNLTAGTSAFNDFLKQNGVDDKSWIPNLKITKFPPSSDYGE